MLFLEAKDSESKLNPRLVRTTEANWRKSLREDITYFESPEHYVSDAIKDSFLDWNSMTPVLISAQTGAGKNTFIEKVLLPQTSSCQKKILIVSNRIALSMQMKTRIVQKIGMKIYSDEWLLENSEFGYVHIYTYHKFLAEKQRLNPAEYLYVVLDEAHFFVSDAIFNYKTGFTLNSFPKEYQDCIRIYMTATPDEVIYHLIESEKKHYKGLSDRFCLVVHELKRDFSYLDTKYFNKMEEIEKEICFDIETKNKWLIFVTSKKRGKELENRLLQAQVDAIYLDAEIKIGQKDDTEKVQLYNTILKKENFPNKVLIATSFLDNGINFKDESLKNIVVLAYDRTLFLQMLGRKRVGNQERVTVYLQNKTADMVNGKLYGLREKLAAIEKFQQNQNDFLDEYYNRSISNFEIVLGLFYFDRGQLRYNPLGNSKIRYDYDFLTMLLDRIDQDPNADVKEQLKWIGLENTFDDKNFLSYSGKQESIISMKEFFKQNLGQVLEPDIFGYEVKRLYTAAFGPRRSEQAGNPYGETIINNILLDLALPYEVVFKTVDKIKKWQLISKH